MLIRSGAQVNAKAPTGATALQPAAGAGRLDAIRLLADHGAAATALDLAASAGATDIVSVLLSKGADPNVSGRNGVPPLADASLGGFRAIVSLLLDHGAVVDRVNEGSGTTALYAAASFGNADVVQMLLDRRGSPTL